MTPFVRFFRLALVTGLLAACTSESPKPSISQVVVTPGLATISVGESFRMSAAANIEPAGSAFQVSWTSNNSAAATADSTGLVVGVAASAGVSICAVARTGDASSSMQSCATVTVMPASCLGPSGLLIPPADTMHVGDVTQFQIPAAQLTGRDPALIRWKLDNPAVASVDSVTGAVTALGVGSANVIATDRGSTTPCPRDWRAPVIVR